MMISAECSDIEVAGNTHLVLYVVLGWPGSRVLRQLTKSTNVIHG
jgi:hypothetical protein